MATTEVKWNTGLKGDNATIGEDGLSVIAGKLTNNMVISTVGRVCGKYYCEIKLNSDSYRTSCIGVCTKNIDVKGSYSQSCAWSYYAYDGSKYHDSVNTSYGSGYVADDVIGIALDLTNHTVEFYKNGVSQGVAFENLPQEEIFISFCNASTSYTVTATANFGATQFDYPIPDGYYPYNLDLFKFLLRQNNKYYTIKDGELSLSESQILNKNNFENNGFSKLSLLNNIDKTDMKLLVYDESNSEEMTLKFTLKQPFRPIDKFEGKIKILKQEMK